MCYLKLELAKTMATKLVSALTETLDKNLQKKLKLCINESKLDTKLLANLKLIFNTSSTRRVVEIAFQLLAVSELSQQKSIYKFPSYDYVEKLKSFDKKQSKQRTICIHIPTWMIVATSRFIKEKYKKFQFKSLEEVVKLVISFTAHSSQYLLSPQ